MPRAFLITLLLAAQLISWNASPLFLCMDEDGAVCIDLGPGFCACGGHHHDLAEGAPPAPVLPDRHKLPDRVGGLPCDCTHLQITVSLTAVTIPPKTNRSIVLPSPTALVGHCDRGQVFSLSSGGALVSPDDEGLSSASVPRSAILRC